MGIFDGVKKYKFWLASFVLVFAFAGVAEAATLISPSKSDGSVVVSASDSFKNLYTAGANVTINGAVTGDLTAVGALVNLVGDVEQDVMLVGGTLNLSGKIGGDARLAGANITFTAPVGGDVVLAGGNVNFTEKAAVGGDLVLAGGNVYIDAPVNGHIKIVGGNININSQVAGDVEIISSKSLTFGPRAEVLGKISHKGPAEAVVEPGAKVSGIEYTKINTRGYRSGLMAIATIGFVVKFLALLIASWLLLYLRKHKVHQISDNVQAKPWNALGWGLVGVIVMPIVSVFLLLTFGWSSTVLATAGLAVALLVS